MFYKAYMLNEDHPQIANEVKRLLKLCKVFCNAVFDDKARVNRSRSQEARIHVLEAMSKFGLVSLLKLAFNIL